MKTVCNIQLSNGYFQQLMDVEVRAIVKWWYLNEMCPDIFQNEDGEDLEEYIERQSMGDSVWIKSYINEDTELERVVNNIIHIFLKEAMCIVKQEEMPPPRVPSMADTFFINYYSSEEVVYEDYVNETMFCLLKDAINSVNQEEVPPRVIPSEMIKGELMNQ